MRLEIARSVAERLVDEAAATPDIEVCGLLFGAPGRIVVSLACRNVSDQPADRFEIDPTALIAAHRAMRAGGPRLIGHYHSHPSGLAEPSPRDAAAAAADGMVWLIVAGGAITAWQAGDTGLHDRFTPLDLAISD